MPVVLPREQWLSHKHFGQNAPDSPKIDGLRVFLYENPPRKKVEILAFVYILKESIISGARYQRVATYSCKIMALCSMIQLLKRNR